MFSMNNKIVELELETKPSNVKRYFVYFLMYQWDMILSAVIADRVLGARLKKYTKTLFDHIDITTWMSGIK